VSVPIVTVIATIDLGDALADIATALRAPVLLVAVLILLLCALELGRFASELWRRRVRARDVDLVELTERAIADPAKAPLYSYSAPGAISAEALVEVSAAARATDPAVAGERALARYELAVQRRLDRTRLLVRAGPAVGLMGTLIPLAPGLAALGEGDVATLADNLRDAFGATVVGLLVGTVAFALTLARTRMYTEDLVALEQAVEK
jgi:biopolymer transport protein ExbB/TolQ